MSKGIIRIAFITRLVPTGGSTSGYAAYEYKPVYLLIPTGQAQIFSGIDVCLSIGRKGNSPHNPGAMEKPMGLPFTVRIKIREGSAIYVKSFAMCKNSSLVMGINPQLFSQEVL